MKFRTSEPCPNPKCNLPIEEYNEETGYIGCPNCEVPREKTLSYKARYESLAYLIYHEGCNWDDYAELIEYYDDTPADTSLSEVSSTQGDAGATGSGCGSKQCSNNDCG